MTLQSSNETITIKTSVIQMNLNKSINTQSITSGYTCLLQ